MEKKKCPYCGKEFITASPNKIFCSKKCGDAKYRETRKKTYPPRKCAVCGKEFTPRQVNQKYCSLGCYEQGNSRRERKPRENQCERKVREHQCTCKRCGKKFTSEWKLNHCEACTNLILQEKKLAQAKVDKAAGKPVKTLSDWAREAAECNLDYGRYRALIESGKTYDELKAQAANHSTPNHAHGRVRKAD